MNIWFSIRRKRSEEAARTFHKYISYCEILRPAREITYIDLTIIIFHYQR